MSKCWYSLLLSVLSLAGCGSHRQPLEVTYIGNEGFLISTGQTKFLVDALTSSEYYVSPSDSLLARIMDGAPPYDHVDYMLVTHDHADHFHPEMTARYLAQHPEVQLIANAQVCSRAALDSVAILQSVSLELERGESRTVRGGKAVVRVLRLDHGSSRDIRNLAFLVTADDHTFLHVGDARLVENEDFLRAVDWSACKVDVLFLEFFDRGSDVQSLIETLIKPKRVVLMHIPGGKEEEVRNSDEKVHAETVVFGREGETKRFEE